MERARRTRSLSHAGFGGADVHRMGGRAGRQPGEPSGLREQLGRPGEELDVSPAVTTVAGLRAQLMTRGGAWKTALAQGRALRVAVNQEMAQPATPVKPGDEVAFFPPVTGG